MGSSVATNTAECQQPKRTEYVSHKPKPTKKVEPSIGIDFGTTFCCVGTWNSKKCRVDIIPNDIGERITPSYVSFDDTQRLIGNPAKNQAARNAENTIFDSKRLIGTKLEINII